MYTEINFGSFEMKTHNIVYLFCVLGVLLICLFTRKKYNLTKLKSVLVFISIMFLSEPEQNLMGSIQNALLMLVSGGELEVGDSQRILGTLFFRPLMFLLISWFIGENFRKISDYIAPATLFAFGLGKLGCLFDGCCHGFPDENGVYSVIYEGNVFPVQLYESISTLAIVVLILSFAYGKIKFRSGTLFPLGSILYASVRFFWENYRYYDNQWESNFLYGLNFWQTCCIAVIVIHICWLAILYLNPKYAECNLEVKDKAPFNVIKYKLENVWHYLEHRNDKNIVHHKKKKKK